MHNSDWGKDDGTWAYLTNDICLANTKKIEKPLADTWKEISIDEAAIWFQDMRYEDKYIFSVVTARNAIVKEDAWACGEQMFNFENCGLKKRLEKLAYRHQNMPNKKNW